MTTLDLRPRCQRCGMIPRGKLAEANFGHYQPFCSYQCQQYSYIEATREHLREIRERQR